jgi:hypothetical protein
VEIWIVLIEDRHSDADALPFSTEAAAVSAAREQAVMHAAHPETIIWDAHLSPDMARDGQVWLAVYGDDGAECVRVVRRTVDAP